MSTLLMCVKTTSSSFKLLILLKVNKYTRNLPIFQPISESQPDKAMQLMIAEITMG